MPKQKPKTKIRILYSKFWLPALLAVFGYQKTAETAVLESTNVMQSSSLSTYYQYITVSSFVKTLEVGGVEPPDSWLTNPSLHHVTPKAKLLYHRIIAYHKKPPMRTEPHKGLFHSDIISISNSKKMSRGDKFRQK